MNAAGRRRRRREGQRGNQQQLCVLSSSPQWTSAWVCDQNSQRVETRTQALQSFTSSPHTSFSSPTSPPQTSSSDLLSFYPSVFHPSFSSDLGLSPPSFLLLFSFVSPCFLPHPLLYFYTSLFCFSTFLLFVLLSLFPCSDSVFIHVPLFPFTPPSVLKNFLSLFPFMFPSFTPYILLPFHTSLSTSVFPVLLPSFPGVFLLHCLVSFYPFLPGQISCFLLCFLPVLSLCLSLFSFRPCSSFIHVSFFPSLYVFFTSLNIFLGLFILPYALKYIPVCSFPSYCFHIPFPCTLSWFCCYFLLCSLGSFQTCVLFPLLFHLLSLLPCFLRRYLS